MKYEQHDNFAIVSPPQNLPRCCYLYYLKGERPLTVYQQRAKQISMWCFSLAVIGTDDLFM